jgi:hypothetical protein
MALPTDLPTNSRNTAAPPFEETAKLAYSYWEQRGCSGGSAEEDWLRAERELRSAAPGNDSTD